MTFSKALFHHCARNFIVRAFVRKILWSKKGKHRFFFVPSYRSYMYLDLTEPLTLRRLLGQYEKRKTNILKRYLKKGMIFVDVGANLGDFSLLAARIVGQTGKVIAFEPDPSNCSFLNRCVEKNKLKNVEILQEALDNQDGIANLYLGQVSGWHTLRKGQLKNEQGKIKVKTRRLDSISLTRLELMKIDVEGLEFEVLQGAKKQLSKFMPVLLIDLHPLMSANIDGVLEILGDLGYLIYGFDSQDKLITYNNCCNEIVAIPKHIALSVIR